ncbi:hypothetical protein HPB49_013479 [Dermacentor silvarum]|uniref:Uncharacterized protein n=1 Tax=Dermacentor silvarum TaxID=543639 RepID=A0ACB8E095_DERSI|nr:hypothetical protein HPB49_013479 [Dermacentor silvarum]
MDIEAPSCTEMHRLLQYGISTFSEASPSRKTPTLISLIASSEGATDDVSGVYGYLAVKDVLPNNRDIVLKLRNKADKRTCNNFVGHRRRLLPRAECDLLAEMGVKDTASLCNTMHRARSPVPDGGRINGQQTPADIPVVEYGDVSSPEYSLCVLCSRPLIHPRDTLPCVLAMLNSITAEVNIDTDQMSTTKQLPLEATREVTKATIALGSIFEDTCTSNAQRESRGASCSHGRYLFIPSERASLKSKHLTCRTAAGLG